MTEYFLSLVGTITVLSYSKGTKLEGDWRRCLGVDSILVSIVIQILNVVGTCACVCKYNVQRKYFLKREFIKI